MHQYSMLVQACPNYISNTQQYVIVIGDGMPEDQHARSVQMAVTSNENYLGSLTNSSSTLYNTSCNSCHLCMSA